MRVTQVVRIELEMCGFGNKTFATGTKVMKIELKQPYKSIQSLTTEELPAFAVLIGRNGAGKTQLLEALKERQAVIPGIAVDDVELYDMVSFSPPNANVADRQANQFAQLAADAYLLSPPGGRPPIETAAAIFDEVANDMERTSDVQARDDFERNLRDEVRHLQDFTVFAVEDRGSPYKKALYERVLAPLNRGNSGREGRRASNQSNNSFQWQPSSPSQCGDEAYRQASPRVDSPRHHARRALRGRYTIELRQRGVRSL